MAKGRGGAAGQQLAGDFYGDPSAWVFVLDDRVSCHVMPRVAGDPRRHEKRCWVGRLMGSLRARSSAVFDLLSPPLVLVTPFVSFMTDSGYSYTAPEFGISIAILSAIGLLCGTVMMLGPARLRVLGTAALITLFVDLQFAWFDVQREVRVPALGIGALLLCWLLRDHLSRIVVPVFATMLVANLLFPDRPEYPSFQRLDLNAGATPMPSAAPPLLVHLILDEFIGIEKGSHWRRRGTGCQRQPADVLACQWLPRVRRGL